MSTYTTPAVITRKHLHCHLFFLSFFYFLFTSFVPCAWPVLFIVSVYRVIKNQPPPVLSINLDHNPFKCSAPGCTKSFRKAKLLHYHMKYYHGEEQPLESECSPTRNVQTRASEKQATATSMDIPKRRRTISASLREFLLVSFLSIFHHHNIYSKYPTLSYVSLSATIKCIFTLLVCLCIALPLLIKPVLPDFLPLWGGGNKLWPLHWHHCLLVCGRIIYKLLLIYTLSSYFGIHSVHLVNWYTILSIYPADWHRTYWRRVAWAKDDVQHVLLMSRLTIIIHFPGYIKMDIHGK